MAQLDSINWEDGGRPRRPAPTTTVAAPPESSRWSASSRGPLEARPPLRAVRRRGAGTLRQQAPRREAHRGRTPAHPGRTQHGHDREHHHPTRTVLLEGSPIPVAMMDALEAAGTYTGLVVERSPHPFNSDHVSFIEQGIPGVLAIAGADSSNDRIHSVRDPLTHVDVELAVEIFRMNVGFVAWGARRSLGEDDHEAATSTGEE